MAVFEGGYAAVVDGNLDCFAFIGDDVDTGSFVNVDGGGEVGNFGNDVFLDCEVFVAFD